MDAGRIPPFPETTSLAAAEGFAMKVAAQFALLSSSWFLLVGLLTGVWKYRHAMASEDGTAPTYVDVAHRASLLYAFASIVLFELVLRSPFTPYVELVAVAAPVAFFTFAVASYVLNGRTRLTDNMFRDPPNSTVLRAAMWGLILAEIGGVGVLVAGFVSTSVDAPTAGAFVATVVLGVLVLVAVLFAYGVLPFVARAVVRPPS